MQFMNSFLLGQAQPQAPTSQWQMATVIVLTVVALVVPFLLGRMIAASLRMKEYGWKIGLILCTTIVACIIIGRTWDPQTKTFRIPQGVDLQGGVILIYEVDQSVRVIDDTKKQRSDMPEPERVEGSYSMSALIEALSRRINPAGTKEIVVRPYGAGQVEIIIPEVDQRAVDQIKKVISTSGVLEFRIVANTRDHDDIIQAARTMAEDPIKKRSRIVFDSENAPIGLWARVGREQNPNPDGIRPFKVDVSGNTIRDASSGVLLTIPGDVLATERDDDARRTRLARYIAELGIQEIDVLMETNDGVDVKGDHLASVMKSKDEFMNPDILFNLTSQGAPLFADLTTRFSPSDGFHRQLGIVLDNELLSAPNIQEPIREHGRITGRFTEEEVTFLVNILEAGSLPVVLNKNPISQNLISPLLGKQTIEQGKKAVMFATVLVFGFMLVYYRFAGVLACLALALNILFTLAIMVLIKAPLTMPGLAGFVLTIGMSVDANVLVFERIREELARGAALRMAIRNGFARAMSSIIDGNVTVVLTAVILYAIGTDQLRGFSVVLILGIITSMFTSVFIDRVAFDIVERKRILTSLKMFQLVGETHWDFVGKLWPALAFSCVVVLVGAVGVVVRGEDLFDIDFTGGSSVHVKLEKPADSERVREIVDKTFNDAGINYTLTGMSATAGQSETDTFKVDARIKDVEELESLIKKAFQGSTGDIQLAKYSMSPGTMKLTQVPPPTAKPTAEKTIEKPTPEKTDQPLLKSAEPSQPATTEAEKTEPKSEPAKTEPAKTESTAPSATESEKKEEGKAPAETASEEKPKEEKATEEKPAEEKPGESEAAEKKESGVKAPQSKNDLPADSVLALAGQEPDAAKSDAAPAAPPAATTLPAAPATATEPPAAKPADGALNISDKASPGTQAKPATPTEVVEVDLTFGHPINEYTLRAEIEQTAKELNIPLSYFDLSNPAWQGGSNAFTTWTLRIPATQDETAKLLSRLQERFVNTPVWSSSNKIGPQVAGRMQRTALIALVASWFGIIIYVWIRFQNLVFGVAAVIALIHDVLVTIAALAVSRWAAGAMGFLLVEDFKISLTIVAALLTIIGYSINDTIVIFDRLREIRGKSPEITAAMVNASLNQTLSRTFLTAFTVLIVVLVLYAFGGEGIHGFAFAMLIGVISGSYSTIFIATPLVLWLGGKSISTRPKSIAA